MVGDKRSMIVGPICHSPAIERRAKQREELLTQLKDH